jgi:hypothetical protein
MNMKTEKKKEYIVPQMETLELAYETQLLDGSSEVEEPLTEKVLEGGEFG